MFWLSNRLLKQRAVLTDSTRRLPHPPTPISQSGSFLMGTVENGFNLRTPWEGCFSIRQVFTC